MIPRFERRQDLERGGSSQRVFDLRGEGFQAWCVMDGPAGEPAFGGLRRRAAGEEEALAEVGRLARQMRLKCAFAGVPVAGAKGFLRLESEAFAEPAYRAVGRAVEAMGGAWVVGPDLGTGERELGWMREACRWINPAGNTPGPSTARGVLAAHRALARFQSGSSDLTGCVVHVQGVGAVGGALVRELLRVGADVFAEDPDGAAMERLRAAAGALPGTLLTTAPDHADIFAPCALGGVIDRRWLGRSRARAIAVSANDQLAAEVQPADLRRSSCLYLPDFTVNAGAVLEGIATVLERQDAWTALDETEERLLDLLVQAHAHRRTLLAEALRRVDASPRT